MKKLLLLLALFGVLCSSCSKEGDEVSNPQEPPKTEEDVLIIDGDRNYVVDALGGELVVKVKTNKWYGVFIPEEASWITLADTRSLREDELTFIISPNEEFAVRCATLTLSVDWDTFQEITIIQNPASIDIPNNQIWYTSTNGEIILPYIGRGNSYADALTSFGANIISNTYENGKGVITFDSDVTKIGECAFCGYYSSPLLPDSSEEYEGYTLCRNLATILIPNSVTTIGDDAFWNCDSLISVTMPNSVLTIGSGSFRGCYDLISVTIPDSVTSIGSFAFDDCYDLTSVTISDSVTTIGECAFRYCSSLTSVTIPDSVTTIGDYAFGSCSSLQEFKGKFASEDGRCLIIDGTLNSFASVGLTEYTIPDSVTSIGRYAFSHCSSLTSVTIPDSVTTIGHHAFSYCSSLISTTITNGVTTVEDYAFWHCESLTDVVLPNSVATIGDWAFEGCSSLTSVAIGNGVTEIGCMAFLDCTSLTNVYCKAITPPTGSIGMFQSNASNRIIYVPRQSVESYISAEHWRTYASYILGYDFKGDDEEPSTSNNIITYTATSKVEPYSGERNNYADALTSFGANIISNEWDVTTGNGVITFDGDVTKIGLWAFGNCINLTGITIPNSVTEIEQFAFEHCIFTSITIPDSVTTIADESFGGCSHLYEFKGKFASEDGRCLIVDDVLKAFAPAGLTEYTIPYGVVEIGRGTFFRYNGITSVTIPNSVIKIGFAAFEDCSSLTHMVIPNSVTEISEYAFNRCDSLDSIHCTSTIPPHLGIFAFWNTNTKTQLNCKIYVPAESYQDYISADNWMEYAVNIRPYDYKNNCTIESGVSEDTVRWLGKWNSTVNWTYCPEMGWNDEPVTFEINIEHNTVAPNLVKIYGLSVIVPTIAVDGIVNRNGDLVILNYNYAGYDGEWKFYMWALSESGNLSYDRQAVYTMSMDESGNVSCNVGSLNGSPYLVFDIFAYNTNTGGISWYDSSLSYYSGPMSWMKIENGPAALSRYSATVPYRANFQPQEDTGLKVVE